MIALITSGVNLAVAVGVFVSVLVLARGKDRTDHLLTLWEEARGENERLKAERQKDEETRREEQRKRENPPPPGRPAINEWIRRVFSGTGFELLTIDITYPYAPPIYPKYYYLTKLLPPEGGPPRIAIQVKKTLSTYDELAGVLKAASWYISAFNEHNAETGFYRVEIWRADWKIPPTFCEEAAV